MYALREIKSGKLLRVATTGYGYDDGDVEMEYELEAWDTGGLFVAPTVAAAMLPVVCPIKNSRFSSRPSYPLCTGFKPEDVEVVLLSDEPTEEAPEFPSSFFKASDVKHDFYATDLEFDEAALEPSSTPVGWKFVRRAAFATPYRKHSKVSPDDQLEIAKSDYTGKFLYFPDSACESAYKVEEVRMDPKNKGYISIVVSVFKVI